MHKLFQKFILFNFIFEIILFTINKKNFQTSKLIFT